MSNGPEPPSDPEAKKIIDKFAQYVAKNGPGFEEITRQKQYDNPKFAFLFGREYADYYRYQLMCEIQFLSSGGSDVKAGTSADFSDFADNSASSEYGQKIAELRKQISDSENNLKAQNQVLQLQKQMRTETLYAEKQNDHIHALLKQVGLDISQFESLIDHMSKSGSKDTISNSKKWIFDNCQTDQLREVILTYLLHRVRTSVASDSLRLHILYLINDWAHHCQRKKLDNVRPMLSRYVPKLYAYASSSATLDRAYSEKLDKLIGVWEGYKYFDENCYKQLRNPANIMATEQAQIFADQQSAGEEVDRELEEAYRGFEKQHQEFEKHILSQIVELELGQKREKEAKQKELERKKQQEMAGKRRSRFDQGPGSEAQPSFFPSNGGDFAPKIPSLFSANIKPLMGAPPMGGPMGARMMPPAPMMMGGGPPPMAFASEDDLIPKCPYYELPAGMMVPLIGEEDCTFDALDATKLRIPPPEPPNDHLLAQIDRFYTMHTTPEHQRDLEGWEINGLAEFFKKKSIHRDEVTAKMKEKGKTFEDAVNNHFVPPIPMPEQSPEKSSNRRASRRSRSKSRSGSRSRSSSGSSSSSSSASTSSGGRHSRSRSPSRSPKHRRIERSASPDESRPSFGGASSTSSASNAFVPQHLVQSSNFKAPLPPLNRDQNKGAQLMAKMGWEGRGLGAKEQGIEEPIHPGEVRDRDDQYRGIGSKADIYEEFRKQMSVKKLSGSKRRTLD